MTHRLYIRNMVCPRCVLLVGEELRRLGLQVESVALGVADVQTPDGQPPAPAPIRAAFAPLGFELLLDPRDQLVEQIKAAVVELVHYPPDGARRYTPSAWLSERLGRDYRSLSHVFSARTGLTLEKYIIRQRIERVKELLSYPDGRSVAEIAAEMGYSSPAHLTNQFRQVTGMAPSAYRALGPERAGRQSLDALL